MNKNLIAFTGYARAGKDEAAKPLIEAGWKRHAFGDLIKLQLDPLIRQHLGFSAFTELDSQKQTIRGTLEQWGESNYFNIMRDYFDILPEKCVNVRLCRKAEAMEWKKRGGIIVEVRRMIGGVTQTPSTSWEEAIVTTLRNADLVDIVLVNDASPKHLHATMRQLFVADEFPLPIDSGCRPRTFRCSRTVLASE
jgi:hypothetical protein